MSTIRVHCPRCDTDPDLAAGDVTAAIVDHAWGIASWRCPHCRHWRSQPLTVAQADLLMHAGCPLYLVGTPTERRGLHPSLGAITKLTVAFFAAALEDDDRLAAAVTALEAQP